MWFTRLHPTLARGVLRCCSEVYAWGINDFGMLGNGTTSYATSPGARADARTACWLCGSAATPWRGAIKLGRAHDQPLLCAERQPCLTMPPTPFPELPLPSERVVGLEGVFVADVAAGGWHSMAISTEGGGRHLLAWLSSVFTPRTLRRARFGCVGETSGLASLDDRP